MAKKKRSRNSELFKDGVISIHSKGFAFVDVEDRNGSERFFIRKDDVRGSWDGDFVGIRIKKKTRGESREAVVVKILERRRKTIVGTFFQTNKNGYVMCDEAWIGEHIYISKKETGSAKNGDKVVVEMKTYPELEKKASGKIINILGNEKDIGMDILSALYKKGIPVDFPMEVINEAEAVSEIVSDKDRKGRVDLREECIITIDGEDAKDLDDAVHVRKLSYGNYLLGVHIADVSYYIQPFSALDKEALERGTSVYLADRVVPMLPKRLSNGICSLNPNVDRLTITCEMEIDAFGNVVRREIYPSVIHTAERMTYTDVRKMLVEKDDNVLTRYQNLVPMINEMEVLQGILQGKREKRGSIDFDIPEAKLKVNEQGEVEGIYLRQRSVAEKIIEEFMLIANETVAKALRETELPGIYRIHEKPKEEKKYAFLQFSSMLGYQVKEKSEGSKLYQQILRKVKGEKEEKAISSIMLRSMQQAKYHEEPSGHFGLAAEDYTHFTSPIRRYPDLIVHRLLRTYFFEKNHSQKVISRWEESIPKMAQHSSKMERRAIEVEREVETMKKVGYMKDKVGETYKGIISGVMKFGFFVELENTVEGLVPIETIEGDHFEYHEEMFSLIGEKTGRRYRIGDEVTVSVRRVDEEQQRIDLELKDE